MIESSASGDQLSDQQPVPQHLAVIMDGNNRWAKQRNLPGAEGHRAGAKALRELVKNCANLGVKALTVFAFSSENWQRPEAEVNALMELFMRSLTHELPDLHKNNIRLTFVGDTGRFSPALQAEMQKAIDLTANNTHMTFVVAVSYGGRWDIVEAAKKLTQQVVSEQLSIADISEAHFSAVMSLTDLPDLDLMIRTGGERRISNFLLWQVAYAELFFSDLYWPDFDLLELKRAFADFASRQRRFGLSGDQIVPPDEEG